MSDLITSLRALAAGRHDDLSIAVDAVIEIERLRADLATQQGCCDGAAAQDAHVRQEREEHRAEIEKLRAALREAASLSSGCPWCKDVVPPLCCKALEGKP